MTSLIELADLRVVFDKSLSNMAMKLEKPRSKLIGAAMARDGGRRRKDGRRDMATGRGKEPRGGEVGGHPCTRLHAMRTDFRLTCYSARIGR